MNSTSATGENPTSNTPAPVLRVLIVGDVVGTPGRTAVRRLLPGLRRELALDLVIANAENSAGNGRGVGVREARELRDAGCDILTTGNHVWDQPDIEQALADDDLRLIRPLNFEADAPGVGFVTTRVKGHDVTVANLIGRVFLPPRDDPFRAADALFANLQVATGSPRPLLVVDFHAEATSEKQALGWHLAGRAAVVVGTHTHVPTADARVLPGGTGYVTDLGMVGPRNSVIGMAVEPSLRRFVSYRSPRNAVAGGDVAFNAVLAELDPARGECRALTRVDQIVAEGGPADRPHRARF